MLGSLLGNCELCWAHLLPVLFCSHPVLRRKAAVGSLPCTVAHFTLSLLNSISSRPGTLTAGVGLCVSVCMHAYTTCEHPARLLH